MSDDDFEIVDWVHFERSRAELGAGFIRILSYFREDGAKSVAQIEEAMHDAEYGRARPSRAHDQGRSAPVRRGAARARSPS